MNDYHYEGSELALFKDAVNWKKYYSDAIKPYIQGNVLEVGAGIGVNIPYMVNNKVTHWTSLEPDSSLFNSIDFPDFTSITFDKIKGVTENLDKENYYDTIVYIDVIEHIEDHRAELERAKSLLKPKGTLILLAPAYQSLFNEFDHSIGHYRRYNKKTLSEIIPNDMVRKELYYLDSLGSIASLCNKLILHQTIPTKNQIKFWDNTIVSLSKVLDIICFRKFGKSLIGIWEKEGEKL